MVAVGIRSDSSRAINRLRKLRRKAKTLPWRQAGDIVKQSVQVNFVLGGSPRKWAPRKVSRPWPVLRKSDTLMLSIYNKVLSNAVAIGTRKVYAAVHNFGYKPFNILKRKYLFAKREDINNIKRLFKKHMQV